jgi:hypothetical protein
MKSLRLSRVGGVLIFLLVVAALLAAAMSGRLAFIHAASTGVSLTVHISSPVQSVMILSAEGGMQPICVAAPDKTVTVLSAAPININEYTDDTKCGGTLLDTKYIDTGAEGSTMTVDVP